MLSDVMTPTAGGPASSTRFLTRVRAMRGGSVFNSARRASSARSSRIASRCPSSELWKAEVTTAIWPGASPAALHSLRRLVRKNWKRSLSLSAARMNGSSSQSVAASKQPTTDAELERRMKPVCGSGRPATGVSSSASQCFSDETSGARGSSSCCSCPCSCSCAVPLLAAQHSPSRQGQRGPIAKLGAGTLSGKAASYRRAYLRC